MPIALTPCSASHVTHGPDPNATQRVHDALAPCVEPLLRYAQVRSVDRHAAHDAVQEALLAALLADRAGQEWPSDEEQWKWLVTVVRNKIADEFRRRGRRPLCLATLGVDAADLVQPVVAGTELPDALASKAEVQQLCWLAVSALPPRYQRVLELVHRDGTPQRDVADAMGVSLKAVEALLARARRELQRELQRQISEPETLL